MSSELIEFDLFSLDNWRGLTELEKFEFIENTLREGPVHTLIHDPVQNTKRWCDEKKLHYSPLKIHNAVPECAKFEAVEFDRDDKVIRLRPLCPEALSINPNETYINTCFITDDRLVDGKVFSDIKSILCFYTTVKTVEDEAANENSPNHKSLVETGYIHD